MSDYQIAIVGPSGAGKSSLIHYLKEGSLPLQQFPTMCIDQYSHQLQIQGHIEEIRIQMWDTPGQEIFHHSIYALVQQSQAYLLMFDISKSQSFQIAKQRLKIIREKNHSNQSLIYAIGNKIDLLHPTLKDSFRQYWEKQQIQYIEVSLKSGQNTSQLLNRLFSRIWLEIDYKLKRKEKKATIILEEPLRKEDARNKKKCCQ